MDDICLAAVACAISLEKLPQFVQIYTYNNDQNKKKDIDYNSFSYIQAITSVQRQKWIFPELRTLFLSLQDPDSLYCRYQLCDNAFGKFFLIVLFFSSGTGSGSLTTSLARGRQLLQDMFIHLISFNLEQLQQVNRKVKNNRKVHSSSEKHLFDKENF